MSDVKFSGLWALVGFVSALFAFTFNYNMVPLSLPGYELFAGPAMLVLRLFSEEIAFWPKLTIFLVGQYLVYFLVILLGRKIRRFYQNH